MIISHRISSRLPHLAENYQQNIHHLSAILLQYCRRRLFHHFESVLPPRRTHLATPRRGAAAGFVIAAEAAASFAANASVVSSAIVASAGANVVAAVVVGSLSSHRSTHMIRLISQFAEEGFAERLRMRKTKAIHTRC